LASALVARADVTPSEPGPGDSFNAGATCHVSWDGDKDSTTAWKNMSIQLMSGSNTAMTHITTVATGQDGTTSGVFDFPCPNVIPNSAIYFYQFTAPGSPDKTWTTRFTIASSSGATTPPANANQPGGEPIPWGTGALADPSKAVPPPNGVTSGPISGSGAASSSGVASASASGSASGSASPSFTLSSASRMVTASSSQTGVSSPKPSGSGTVASSSNAAVGSFVLDTRVWQAALATTASFMTVAIFL
ncbi:hypothetical protein BD779DRAFT_1419571, partial [Infundibulicybe gibba]